jgi:outer membrane protein assembly factor BamD
MTTTRRGIERLALVLALVFAAACQGGGSGSRRRGSKADDAENEKARDPDFDRSAGFGTPGRGEVTPSVTYAHSAEDNWKLGEDAFKDDDFLAAQRYFSYIKSKFPYSQYTVLAELRIGDCQFARGRFIEAIDTYQNFQRLHPTHEKVSYALYRTGLCYYQQIPGDWFMLPPSEEKEQTAVRDAERVLRDYVERYPIDANIADGRKMMLDVRRKLLAHERYVANFYRRLGKDRAYVGRLQVIRTSFSDVGLNDDLLLEIATVYARLGEMEEARAAVQELEQKFPGSPKLNEARRVVGSGTAESAKKAEDPKISGLE